MNTNVPKDNGKEKAQKEAMIVKINSVAKNEGSFFGFDAQGKPSMV